MARDCDRELPGEVERKTLDSGEVLVFREVEGDDQATLVTEYGNIDLVPNAYAHEDLDVSEAYVNIVNVVDFIREGRNLVHSLMQEKLGAASEAIATL